MRRLPGIISVAIGLAVSSAHASLIYHFDSVSPGVTPTVATTTVPQIYQRSTLFCSSSGGEGKCGPILLINTTSLPSIFRNTPLLGFSLDISDLSFDEAQSGDFGRTGFDVLTRIDVFSNFENYLSAILSTVLSPGAASLTQHSTDLESTDIFDPFELRIASSAGP